MTAALKVEIEKRFEVGEPTTSTLSVTGEPYIVIQGHGGAEGAKAAFDEYAHGKAGRLYWRSEPEFETTELFYMRLLISDKEAK